MSKKKDNQKTEVKAEDKAVATVEETTMTKADYFAELKLVGVTPPAKTVKADLEKLFEENSAKIDVVKRLPDLKKACLIKAFGDHGSSGICPKCKKQQADIYKDCGIYKDIAGAVKQASKKERKMGHRTGDALFHTRKGTMANRFCKYVVDSGDKGFTMAEAKKARWNPKGYPFKESLDRLVEEGIVEKREDRFYITDFGLEQAGKKKKAA